MDIGFEAPFDGHLAVRGGSDRRRHPLDKLVDRDLFTFIDSSTDLESTCPGTKKLIGPFSRRVDRVGGDTDSYNSPTDHPHSSPSGFVRGIRTKENPRGGEELTLEETVILRGHLCRCRKPNFHRTTRSRHYWAFRSRAQRGTG